MPHSLRACLTGMLVFACSLVLPVSDALAGNAETSKQSLEALKDRIKSLSQELESTRGAHSEAADALKESERAISETNRKLHQIQRQQQQSQATLKSLAQEKAALQTTIAAQQSQLTEQLRQQYRQGQASHLQILLSGQDPNQLARDLQYFGYLARARSQQIEALRDNLDKIAALNARTAETLAEIEALKTEQEQQKQQLENDKQQRKQVITKLAQQIKSQRSEISKLKRDEQRLSDLVKRLARIVPAKPKPSSPSKSLGTNETLPSRSQSGIAFASLKGKLNLPVRGDIANRYGSPREDSGVTWKGVFIRAQEGAQVKSVASGTVVFADWLRGFGNLIIIDHGSDYMSLYGNNQALLKQVGEEVQAGDDIASVGSSGGNPESGVYFELRHRSNPFDPLSWSQVR